MGAKEKKRRERKGSPRRRRTCMHCRRGEGEEKGKTLPALASGREGGYPCTYSEKLTNFREKRGKN